MIMIIIMIVIIMIMITIIMIVITSSDARWLPMGADGVGALEAEMTRVAGNLIVILKSSKSSSKLSSKSSSKSSS